MEEKLWNCDSCGEELFVTSFTKVCDGCGEPMCDDCYSRENGLCSDCLEDFHE